MSLKKTTDTKNWKKHYEGKRHVALVFLSLGALVAAVTIATGTKTLFFSSPTHTQSSTMTGDHGTQVNAGTIQSLTLNQPDREKDSSTPEGAREALGRMGLKFDNDDFSEAVREANLTTVKLYLIGGMSPNSTYDGEGLFVITLPILQNAPHFKELVNLMKEYGLDWKAVSPIPMYSWYLGEDIETQQTQALLFAAGNNRVEQARILENAGANPSAAIAAGKRRLNYPYAKRDYDFLVSINH